MTHIAYAGVLTLSMGDKAVRLTNGLLVVGESPGSANGSSVAILGVQPLLSATRGSIDGILT